jgi:hypothetical protein
MKSGKSIAVPLPELEPPFPKQTSDRYQNVEWDLPLSCQLTTDNFHRTSCLTTIEELWTQRAQQGHGQTVTLDETVEVWHHKNPYYPRPPPQQTSSYQDSEVFPLFIKQSDAQAAGLNIFLLTQVMEP